MQPRRPLPLRWRLCLGAGVLLMGTVAGCSADGAPDEDAGSEVPRPGSEGDAPGRRGDAPATLAELEAAVAAVAAEQETADVVLEAALQAVRDADLLVRQVREPFTVDVGLEGAARVHADLAAVDPEAIRDQLREVAVAVDRARAGAAVVRARLEPGSQRYLDAQDAVLVAVRQHAEAGDAVAQVIDLHHGTYLAVLDAVEEQARRRDDLRDTTEAVQAVEVAIDGLLDDLAAAQADLRRYRETRDETARRVNETSADAAAAFERRTAP